jgi:hypothetical protein
MVSSNLLYLASFLPSTRRQHPSEIRKHLVKTASAMPGHSIAGFTPATCTRTAAAAQHREAWRTLCAAAEQLRDKTPPHPSSGFQALLPGFYGSIRRSKWSPLR